MNRFLAFVQSWDLAVLALIQEHLRSPFLDWLTPVITRLGDAGIIWLIAACALIVLRKYQREGHTVLFAIAVEHILNDQILKRIFHRPRPFTVAPISDMLIGYPGGWSLPSGHTAVSFAAAMALYCYNKRWGIYALILAALIGFSRMYLYVHFPTDVLTGMAVGVICGAVCAGISMPPLPAEVTR